TSFIRSDSGNMIGVLLCGRRTVAGMGREFKRKRPVAPHLSNFRTCRIPLAFSRFEGTSAFESRKRKRRSGAFATAALVEGPPVIREDEIPVLLWEPLLHRVPPDVTDPRAHFI